MTLQVFKRYVIVLTVWAMGLLWVLAGGSPVSASALVPAAGVAVTTPGGFTSLAPSRLLDTRSGVGAARAAVPAGGTVQLQVTGRGGVPVSGVSSVVLNVTVTEPGGSGFVTAFADGSARPLASNLNFVKGQTVPNLVIAPVGANGRVALYNGSGGTVQLVADVAGWFSNTTVVSDPPGPVTAVSATPSSTSVTLSWTNPTSASLTGVTIRRATGPAAPSSATAGDPVAEVAMPVTAFTDTGLTSGTQYSYALFAHNLTPAYAAGVPVTSTTNTVFPVIPGSVTSVIAAPSDTSIALSWTNPTVASLTGVMIRRALGTTVPGSATEGTLVTDAVPTLTSFTDTGVTWGTEYTYALFAHNGTPVYAAGAMVTATTTVPIPGPVTALTAVTTSTSVALSWANPSTASLTGVTIRRMLGTAAPATATDGTEVTDAATTVTSFTDTGVTWGTEYTYALFAHNRTPVYAAGATVTATTAMSSISGTVTEAGGAHNGLANVQVQVSSASAAVVNGTTDANGTYEVSGLPAGTYTVCFIGSGAVGGSSDALAYVDQCWKAQPKSGTPTPVGLAGGATKSGINAALAAAGAISGRVTEAGGSAGVANVRVQVYSPSRGSSVEVRTNVDGSYTVSGLAAGAGYEVCFYSADATSGASAVTGYIDQCYNNQPTTGLPTPVTVTAGATRSGINAALDQGGAISGTVTDSGASPQVLANVGVMVSSAISGSFGYATTAADGSYTVSGLAAGTDYVVCFSGSGATGGTSVAQGYINECYDNQPNTGTPTAVAVALGGNTLAINAALDQGGAISGRVTDAGGSAGLENVSVYLSPPAPGGNATTAADGSYTVSGLEDATDYLVCFSATGATGGASDVTGYIDECYDGQPITGTPTLVTVIAGATMSGINAALARGGAISGTVTDAGTSPQGLANVGVTVSSSSAGAVGSATTAADGSYTVSGLVVGTDYVVCFSGFGATGGASDALGYIDQCYNGQPITGTPTPVTVNLVMTTTGMDAALEAYGAISGTVTDAGASPQGLAYVGVMVSSLSTGAFEYVATAADGSYTVSGLGAATDYEVCFLASGATGGASDATGYVDRCYDNQPAGTSTPVTVTLGGAVTGINAALVAGGAITGLVTDGTAPLADVEVLLDSPTAGVRAAYTAADGTYSFVGLSDGSDYTVCFNGVTGSSCWDNQPDSGSANPVTVTSGLTTSDINGIIP